MRVTNISYGVQSKYFKVTHNLIDELRLNVTAELSGTVTKFLLHVEVFVMPLDGSSKYHSFMVKSMEVCSFLANPWSEPMLNFVWKELAKDYRHNVVLECPVHPVS